MNNVKIRTTSSETEYLSVISRQSSYLYLKRLVDIVLSMGFLILLSPLIFLISVGIQLHSPGPVFYKQRRIGLHGRPFEMYKFRSMRVGNDSKIHQEHVRSLILQDISPTELGEKSLKIKADPRVTGIGKMLRKLSLDEIPQFINVLKGEMSIVGPRPPLPYEYEVYSSWHKLRLAAPPGITGLWQVTAHNQVSFSEMVQLDLDYIARMSLWLDLKIMALTPFEMIRGKGGG